MKKTRLRKKKPEPQDDGEWWKPGYVPPEPEKKSLLERIRTRSRMRKPHVTMLGVKQIVTLILLVLYGTTVYTTMLKQPQLLLILVPTIVILLDYIKQTRKRNRE